MQEVNLSDLDAFDSFVHMLRAEGMTAGPLPPLILPFSPASQLLQGTTGSWSHAPIMFFFRDNDI